MMASENKIFSIDELEKNFEGWGRYQIIWSGNNPVRIKKIPDDLKIEVFSGKYYIINGGASTQLYSSEYIEFTQMEERNFKLQKLLK